MSPSIIQKASMQMSIKFKAYIKLHMLNDDFFATKLRVSYGKSVQKIK